MSEQTHTADLERVTVSSLPDVRGAVYIIGTPDPLAPEVREGFADMFDHARAFVYSSEDIDRVQISDHPDTVLEWIADSYAYERERECTCAPDEACDICGGA